MIGDIFSIIFTTEFGFSILRLTTPILFAAMAALVSNKAGTPNIGLEGIMLFASLGGVLGSAFLGSVWLGLLFAILTGMLMSFIMAFFALKLKTDIILAGIIINLLGSGGTVFLLYAFTGQHGNSEHLNSGILPNIGIPLIKDIPVIGEIFSGHCALTYVSLLSVLFVWIFLYKTRPGMRIRAVGENADAATSVGISVIRTQMRALLISGFLTGMAGAYMSMSYVSFFAKDMTGGRGFIALAAEAMGNGRPLPTMISSFIFGAADSLANNITVLKIPSEFVEMIPYITTIVGLIIYSVRKQKKLQAKKKTLQPIIK